MDLQLFFDNFDVVAAAPNGVKKLRELILQLAVRGKLVPQDPADEPAGKLLERIQKEKEKLIQDKKIRNSKPLPTIDESEIWHEVPKEWISIRLGEIGDWGAGSTPDRKNPEFYGGSIKWLKSGELNDGYVDISEEHVTELALQKCSLRLNKEGDVLIAMYGATIGKTAILKAPATTNQAVCACTCFSGFHNRYLLLLLKAYKSHFTGQGAGGAQPNISREKIIHTVAALPPIAEQKRIVTKVDELMKLCDRLETQQQQNRSHLTQMQKGAIGQLLSAPDADAFAQHWQDIVENFELLFDDVGAIGDLRQAILQLAVQGKLVRQDSSDKPAAVVLEKIRTERKELFASGKLAKLKQTQDIEAGVDGIESIPPSWIWTRLGELLAFGPKNGHSPKPVDYPTPVKSLTLSATTSGRFDGNCYKYIDEEIPEESHLWLQVDDILIQRGNSLEYVGISAIYTKQSERFIYPDLMMKIRLSK